MKINDVILSSVVPIGLSVLLADNQTVEIVAANEGEALIRFGDQAVERYTALATGVTDFDPNEFWKQMFNFDVRMLMLPDENKFTGFDPIRWDVLGVLSTVANFDENPKLEKILVNHEYTAKTFMPALKRDIKIEYRREDQTDLPRHYHFADMMDALASLGSGHDAQFLVSLSPTTLTVTAKYKGVRDNRHLKVNAEFDELLGKRHAETKENKTA